jgi:hypothetical protein
MKTQLPAEGILKRNDWGDAVSYQVVCQCFDPEHDHSVWIEAEDKDITITTCTTQKSKWWKLDRWHLIWTLLTKGYIEYEANIIMSEQQALNYAETLKHAIKNVKEFRKTKISS